MNIDPVVKVDEVPADIREHLEQMAIVYADSASSDPSGGEITLCYEGYGLVVSMISGARRFVRRQPK